MSNGTFKRDMGDINGFPDRIKAGTAGDQGGLVTGDSVYRPLVLWEPTYDLVRGGDKLAFTLSLWEWDGGGDTARAWLEFLKESSDKIGKAVIAFTGPAGEPYVRAGQLGLDLLYKAEQDGLFGNAGDRPLGMKDDGSDGTFEYDPKMLILDYDRAALLSKADFGLGPGVSEVSFTDADDRLHGDYTMRIRVEDVTPPPPPPPPPPGMRIGDVRVAEGDSGSRFAYLPVTLPEPKSATVTVNYATADGLATQPGDYAARSGTLTFPAGVVTRTIAVPIKGDRVDETIVIEGTDTRPTRRLDEKFSVKLSSPTNTNITDGTGIVTVVDDDPDPEEPAPPPVRLTVGDVTIDEGTSGTRRAVFTVSLSKASASTVTVSYATVNQTATTPADYAARSGTLTFSPGVVSKSVSVPVRADTTAESSELFKVALSNATGGATITDATGLRTIRTDD